MPTSAPAPGSAAPFARGAVVAAVLALGLAFYAWSSAWRARTALTAASRSYHAAQEAWRAAVREEQAAARERVAAAGMTASAASPARATPPPPAAPPARSPAEQKAAWQKFLALHPEVRDLVVTVGRRQFEITFGPFLKSAGFSPGQIDQLEPAAVDAWFAGFALGPKGDVRATGDFVPAPEQLRAILGDAGAQQYQDFNRTLPALGVATQIAAKAGLASAPLSTDQVYQLAQVVTANSPAYAAGKTVAVPTVDWTAAQAQISALPLSPAQALAAQRVILGFQYQAALRAARTAAGGSP